MNTRIRQESTERLMGFSLSGMLIPSNFSAENFVVLLEKREIGQKKKILHALAFLKNLVLKKNICQNSGCDSAPMFCVILYMREYSDVLRSIAGFVAIFCIKTNVDALTFLKHDDSACFSIKMEKHPLLKRLFILRIVLSSTRPNSNRSRSEY